MQQVIILGFCFLYDMLIEEWCICISDVDVRDPDEKSIMTYVAQFLQYSKDASVSDEEMQVSHTHIYIYAFSRRFYPKRLTITFSLYIFISMCVPWESNPQPFALLTQCSTTEPHRNTHTRTHARTHLF